MNGVQLFGIENLPEIRPQDDLIALLSDSRPALQEGDILVVTQKVVSKAEGRLVCLQDVNPSPRAVQIAREYGKDPGLVELVIQESQELIRVERGVLISRTREGFVCANAGIDLSNVDGGQTACLLPLDCNDSAKRISQGLAQRLHFPVPVIVSDSFGRPWRLGITNVALGSHGLEPLLDYRGTQDPYGLEMKATVIAVADSIAAATELVVGKVKGFGASILRHYDYQPSEQSDIGSTIRPWKDCFFT